MTRRYENWNFSHTEKVEVPLGPDSYQRDRDFGDLRYQLATGEWSVQPNVAWNDAEERPEEQDMPRGVCECLGCEEYTEPLIVFESNTRIRPGQRVMARDGDGGWKIGKVPFDSPLSVERGKDVDRTVVVRWGSGGEETVRESTLQPASPEPNQGECHDCVERDRDLALALATGAEGNAGWNLAGLRKLLQRERADRRELGEDDRVNAPLQLAERLATTCGCGARAAASLNGTGICAGCMSADMDMWAAILEAGFNNEPELTGDQAVWYDLRVMQRIATATLRRRSLRSREQRETRAAARAAGKPHPAARIG